MFNDKILMTNPSMSNGAGFLVHGHPEIDSSFDIFAGPPEPSSFTLSPFCATKEMCKHDFFSVPLAREKRFCA
jgi:hypothetical protein